ncbi:MULTISPECIES: helix-turn-helix domain-containing protein [Mesonia]|uniref:HTH-type transcriptional activator RhaS n=1 Tax=Mesonia oceanica TaxID=2687242 RepID=A0AC61YBE6_9FLAO|nr:MULTISPECIES: response regulator transcription factor [Mesonia]VVV00695.1 HTH-type transcriptional activator RhaS [Mesonia oceanica]
MLSFREAFDLSIESWQEGLTVKDNRKGKTKTKVSHMANKDIKSLLDQCTKTALQHNPEMKQYEYFEYSANEALMLSEQEEKTIVGIMENIQQEYHANIDNFSQDIIIAHLETLLNYANRFYHRQFLTQKKVNHQILDKFEKLLLDYFKNATLTQKGLPTVQYVSEELNVSVSYLSRLLKTLTGQSTQQHIHDKLIEKAKERLATTELTVGEIAYELGFEHSQSFSKLFKIKTNQSPLEFRQSFN